MKNLVKEIKKELHLKSDVKKAKILANFFKTGKGQYGEDDIFIGVTIPDIRKIVKKFIKQISLADLDKIKIILSSKIHEERMCALLFLVELYENSKIDLEKRKIVKFYFDNIKQINNWDLIDITSYKILGQEMLKDKKTKERVLKLANSNNLWHKRIAIISTFSFIKNHQFSEILFLAKKLITDKEDLIQKAIGWMLREVGKRDQKLLKNFLNENAVNMPRTMLRYTIEKFPENERKKYLLKK